MNTFEKLWYLDKVLQCDEEVADRRVDAEHYNGAACDGRILNRRPRSPHHTATFVTGGMHELIVPAGPLDGWLPRNCGTAVKLCGMG